MVLVASLRVFWFLLVFFLNKYTYYTANKGKINFNFDLCTYQYIINYFSDLNHWVAMETRRETPKNTVSCPIVREVPNKTETDIMATPPP